LGTEGSGLRNALLLADCLGGRLGEDVSRCRYGAG
jgi:hypothetical protein